MSHIKDKEGLDIDELLEAGTILRAKHLSCAKSEGLGLFTTKPHQPFFSCEVHQN